MTHDQPDRPESAPDAGALSDARGSTDGSVVTVSWTDGSTARFHAQWLREFALHPSCRDPRNGQRLVRSSEIPDGVTVRSIELVDGGRALTVVLAPEGLSTTFPAEWLAARRYDRPGPTSWGWTGSGIERWTGDSLGGRMPTAEYADLVGDPDVRRRWLTGFIRLGVAVLHGVPIRSGAVAEAAEAVGFVRQTNYGRWFDVRARVDPDNLADTTLGLQAHTDNPYRDPVPTLQLLHCLENEVTGGESSVVDGFAAVARLHADAPELAEVLAGHPARFEYAGSADVSLQAKRPVIELGPDGELLAVRINNRSIAAPVDVPFGTMPRFLAAWRRLGEIIDDPAMHHRFRLEPGDLFLVDNRRVLHSRTAFTGTGRRWLQGCYADIDGLASTWRVLQAAHTGDSPCLVDLVEGIFTRLGAEAYLGEDVTMAEHMLQAAALAEADGADDDLVVAALLHDIGHFTSAEGTYSPEAITDHRHEQAGAATLAGYLPDRVVDTVRLHVAAKRYLCAVDPAYHARLSPASAHTLALQGGPMSAAEVAAFETDTSHADAVRVRRWDDDAKVAGRQVPGLDRYRERLERLARR